MKSRIILLFVLLFVATIQAQDLVNFSGQIRTRLILDGRDFNSSTGMNSFSEMRSRFGVKFSPRKNLSAFFQVQDSRVFGSEPATISNTANLDLHQAYFLVDNLFDLPLSLKLGRMEASYGTQRIMSKNNWNNIGRSFDGLTFSWQINNDKSKIDLFAFKLAETSKLDDLNDETLIGAFADLKFISNHDFQPFVLYRTSAAASYPFNAFAIGTYLDGTIENYFHTAEFVYQLGDEIENGPKSLNAFFVGYNLGFNFNHNLKPQLSAGIEYYSGDDNLTDNTYKEGNRWFGAGHKYYGYMDFFPSNTNGLGLADIHLKTNFSPLQKMKLQAAFHIFNSSADYTLINGSTSRNFGNEFDLVLNYKYDENVDFQIGSGLFFPGEIFKETKGNDTATWFYFMGIVNL
ncbi:MAG: alginate export family protein [Melioribacteraceae bacterium]|nr:alginate export family protein [Melioribacteraceae bacterium]